MKNSLVLSFAATLALTSHLLRAESLMIDTITVESDAFSDLTPSDTKVDIKKIQTGSSQTVADALKNESQIDVRKRTTVGDNGDILSIRGLSANRIMLNFDGRALNAAGINGGHYIDWGTIPLENISKIEVIKGGSSIEYGHNALGGVINIIPKAVTAKPTFSIEAIAGAWDGGSGFENIRFSHSHKPSRFGYTISGSIQNADAYLWNNNFKSKNFYTRLYYDLTDSTKLDFGFTYSYSKRGFIKDNNPDGAGYNEKINGDYPISYGDTLAGGGNNPILLNIGEGAFWEKTKYLLDAGVTQSIGDGYAELKLFSNYEDRHEENFSSLDGHKVIDRDIQSDRTMGGVLKFKIPYQNHDFTAGISYTRMGVGNFKINQYDKQFNNNAAYLSPNVNTYILQQGVFVGDSIDLFGKALNINIGARYDKFDIHPFDNLLYKRVIGSGFSPKVTATYKLDETNMLFFALYKNFRTPGIPESYWHFNAANSNDTVQSGIRSSLLKAEVSDNAELSYKYKISKNESVALSAFCMKIKDYIQWRNVSGIDRAVYNIDAVTIKGVSLDAFKNITDLIRASGSITYQGSEKTGDFLDKTNIMKSLEYFPKYKANLAFDFKLPIFKATLGTNTRYYATQKAFNYRSKVVDMQSYTVMDVSLKAPIFKGANLEIFSDNILNKEYQEKYGFAATSRVIGMALRYNY